MLTRDKIERFYEDVKRLGIKKPVAAISRATGDDKSNVSKYLSRKMEPSEEFLDRFYEKFKSSIKVVSKDSHDLRTPLAMGNKPITVQDYIDKINQHNEFIQGMLALSLHDLSRTQKDMYAHLKAAIKRQAERFSKMDPELVQGELDKISIYAGEYQGIDVRKGSHAGGGS